jgi:hypothetical protein
MDAYCYQAALLCGSCGSNAASDLLKEGAEDTGDSNDFPQGPFADGGGESDSPQHCDHCGEFLENPLTSEGVEYVMQALLEDKGSSEVLAEWSQFYDIKLPEADDEG